MYGTYKFWTCCCWVNLLLRPVLDTSDCAEVDRQYKKNKYLFFEVVMSCLVNMYMISKSWSNPLWEGKKSCMRHINFGDVAVK